MELLLSIGLVFTGFILGALVFSRVGHWLVAIHAALRARDGNSVSRTAAVASAALLASGPWLLVALAVFAIWVRNESWAIWLFAGLGAAVVIFGAISGYLARKASLSSKSHAA